MEDADPDSRNCTDDVLVKTDSESSCSLQLQLEERPAVENTNAILSLNRSTDQTDGAKENCVKSFKVCLFFVALVHCKPYISFL